jgi:hypothetical protein
MKKKNFLKKYFILFLKKQVLDNVKRFPVIFGHFPAGTSVMNMQHWQ